MNKIRNFLDKNKENRLFAFFDILIYRIADNKVSISAAALTYYLVLAIFPFLIALLNIVQFFDQSFLTKIMTTLQLLPQDVYAIIETFLQEIRSNSSVALLSISLFGSIYSASVGVKRIINSLNNAYSFTRKRSFIKLLLLSLGMTLALFVLILLIFFVQILGNAFLTEILSFLNIEGSMKGLVGLLMNLVPVLFMFISFFVLYRFAPSWPEGERISNKSLLASALFATFGVIIATFAFNLYVSNFSNYSKTYGSLAGIIIFLVWLFLFGFIILLGGEINATLTQLEEGGAKWPREKSILKNLIGSQRRL